MNEVINKAIVHMRYLYEHERSRIDEFTRESKDNSERKRILSFLKPLFNKDHLWLTVGDYNGFEARFLQGEGLDVIASDIEPIFLKELYERKLIKSFKQINMEEMSFEDEAVDYVLCKESLHHLPRAYMGIYEMIRVSRKGIILIEPIDVLLSNPYLLFLKNLCDKFHPHLINKIWKNRFSWESVGNYVFKISEREIEKIAMGLGLHCIAVKKFNTGGSANYRFLNLLRIIPKNRLLIAILKSVSEEESEKLKIEGYKLLFLKS
jgi:SAM-dependent methyltransferase